MKRTFYRFLLLVLMTAVPFAHAAEDGAIADGGGAVVADGRTKHGPLVRIGMVQGRGILNAAGLPVEIVRTSVEEVKHHHWLWPFTLAPRLLMNILIRTTSIVNDIVLMPFVVPFTDDISPLTEPMDLPEYPWQWD